MTPIALLLLSIVLDCSTIGAPGHAWREVRYRGRTSFTPAPDSVVGHVHAEAHDSNSAWFQRIDRPAAGRLSWRWRVLRQPLGADTRTRRGDDRAAAVLVLTERSVLPWRARGILYQWAAGGDTAVWRTSPYAPGIRVITLCREPASGTWREESRDLRADMLAAFGNATARVAAIGILCDADDTHDLSVAEFSSLTLDIASQP